MDNLSQEDEPGPITVFDNYRSLIDPNILIFVKKDIVPPFRFKAGGWELAQSSIELGPAMKARIAERGYFMCRVKDDGTSWYERKRWLARDLACPRDDRRHLYMRPAPSPRRGNLAFIQFGSNGRPRDNALFLDLLDQRKHVGRKLPCTSLVASVPILAAS